MSDAYTTSDVKRAEALYLGGETIHGVASEIGCSVSTVHRWLRPRGVLRSAREARQMAANTRLGRDYREVRRRSILLYERGLSTYQIAEVLGVWTKTVQRWVGAGGGGRTVSQAMRIRYNDPRHPAARERIRRIQRAAHLKVQGTPVAEIAAEFDVSPGTIYYWMHSEHNPYPPESWRRRAA